VVPKDVTELPALVTDSEPAPELIVAYQEPAIHETPAFVTDKVANVTDEFDFIEIDNDFMRLIAELGELEHEIGKTHRRVA
jgi:hypothetical protein